MDMIIIVWTIMGLAALSVASLAALQFSQIKKRKKSVLYKQRVQTRPIGRYMRLFNWYSDFVLTRQLIAKLHRQITSLSVYSFTEARIQTVRSFNFSLLYYGVIFVVFTVLFHNMIFLIACLILGAIMRENFLHRRVEGIRSKLQKDIIVMLSSLRQEYMRSRSVVEAFENCEKGEYVARAVKEIHDSLIAVDHLDKLEAFCASTPLPTLQTLAMISHRSNNSGDAQTATGSSSFASAIDMIADEVRMAIRYTALQKMKFSALQFIPIVPALAVSPISWVFPLMIPGLSVIYDGATGYIFTLITLFCSLIGYYVVTNATRAGAVRHDDRTNLDKRLMKNKNVRNFVARTRPKKQSVIESKLKLLRTSMSRNTLDYLYLRKMYLCAAAFIVTIILFIGYIVVGRSAIMANVTGSDAMGAALLSPQEIYILTTMDNEFLSAFRHSPAEEDLIEFVALHMPTARGWQVEEQVERLMLKHEEFHGLVFQWWMILLSAAVAVGASFLPEFSLKMRTKLIAIESEEDCLQLQTTIAIMMTTNTDTLDMLEYMYKNSRVFKSVLIDCYQNYVADPFMALRIAKAKSRITEFRTMMDKLSLTVVQITIADAFSDLASERDHMLRMREKAQEQSLDKKRAMVVPFALAPMVALIGLLFIAPIFMFAATLFIEVLESGIFDM